MLDSGGIKRPQLPAERPPRGGLPSAYRGVDKTLELVIALLRGSGRSGSLPRFRLGGLLCRQVSFSKEGNCLPL